MSPLLYPSLENGSTKLTILSLSKERGKPACPALGRDRGRTGKERFSQHNYKIPLYPLLPSGS
ncbi:MAG: hypothetical protein Q8N70_03125, partial [Deltaproteobacteria bacterium]|nr:hypothetical protein [Deltaproteobacteria bacterium]